MAKRPQRLSTGGSKFRATKEKAPFVLHPRDRDCGEFYSLPSPAAARCFLRFYSLCENDGDASSMPSAAAAPATPVEGSMDELLSHARLVAQATTEASSASIAAAVAARQPLLWPRRRSGFVRRWQAHDRWRDLASLDAAVPWANARLDERGDGEFVLTAPQRGGSGALLQAAPSWEPLRVPIRNVTVSTILRGGSSSSSGSEGASSSHHAAPSALTARHYYSGSLGYDDPATSHWRRSSLLEALHPIDPLHIFDVPSITPNDPVQPPAHLLKQQQQAAASRRGGGASGTSSSANVDNGALPTNRTSLRLWLTSSGVLARTHYDKSHNLLCVVSGTKRLLLWPPSELPALHLYPAIHAAHRQSQISITRFDELRAARGEDDGNGGVDAAADAPIAKESSSASAACYPTILLSIATHSLV